MRASIDLADVPAVNASELNVIVEMLIERGLGLALLRGLREDEIRVLEDDLWAEFGAPDASRLATALRFRALLHVFASRRLKALFLERGFRIWAAAVREAARRPLNIRFGFNAQQLLIALDASTAPVAHNVSDDLGLKIAA